MHNESRFFSSVPGSRRAFLYHNPTTPTCVDPRNIDRSVPVFRHRSKSGSNVVASHRITERPIKDRREIGECYRLLAKSSIDHGMTDSHRSMAVKTILPID